MRRGRTFLVGILVLSLTAGMCCGCADKTAKETATSQEVDESLDGDTAEIVGHNEDENANLGAWGRAMGSVLISINDGNPYYFGGYEQTDANAEAAASILKQSWGISDRQGLLEQIDNLLTTGSRKEYLQEAKDMKKLSKTQLKKAMKQLSGSLLIHYQMTRYNWDKWEKKGLLAWDMCRISHLVQWGYIAGYVDVDEAQALMEPAAKKLQKQFTSWEEVITNWLDGYALACTIDINEPGNDYESRLSVYETLVSEQSAKGVLYDDTLFTQEIVPLQQISYTTILDEVRKKADTGKKDSKKNSKKESSEKKASDDGKEEE